MAVQAACPNCGADVVFTTGAPLRVCDHCRAVIARRDRDLENLGKVVDLAPTRSPLALYRDGMWRGARFTLVGRAQLQHPRGGVWDEWYASFADGRWGWLAEAQGRFYMTFPVDGLGAGAPPWESLEPGAAIEGLPPGRYVVAERGEARFASAAGEIPYRFRPNERFRFADLSGPDKAFATIDYGAPGADPGAAPTVYIGHEVTLAELGLAGLAGEERPATIVKADRMACPECDGSLELIAPDQAQRVICPFCGTSSDVTEGGKKLEKLKFLGPSRIKPQLPLGGKGVLFGKEWRVCGFMQRYTTVDGIDYDWDEYLLYHQDTGFRWLVQAAGHWSFVEPLAAGEIDKSFGYLRHPLVGRRAKLFQQGNAHVRHAVGEFTWKIELGETTWTEDYVAPPHMISLEKDHGEVNYSLGTYVRVEEVEQAFGVTTLLAPRGVAPHQPHGYDGTLKLWGAALAVVFVLAIAVFATRGTRTIAEYSFSADPPGSTGPWVHYSEPFELRGKRNVEVVVSTPLQNDWVYVEGDLVDEQDGWVQPFEREISYYSGYEGGESWSEGSSTQHIYLSAQEPGWYVLRLEVQASMGIATLKNPVYVKVRQGVPRWTHLGLLLAGVSLVPLIVLGLRIAFEKQRWSESNVTGDE